MILKSRTTPWYFLPDSNYDVPSYGIRCKNTLDTSISCWMFDHTSSRRKRFFSIVELARYQPVGAESATEPETDKVDLADVDEVVGSLVTGTKDGTSFQVLGARLSL